MFSHFLVKLYEKSETHHCGEKTVRQSIKLMGFSTWSDRRFICQQFSSECVLLLLKEVSPTISLHFASKCPSFQCTRLMLQFKKSQLTGRFSCKYFQAYLQLGQLLQKNDFHKEFDWHLPFTIVKSNSIPFFTSFANQRTFCMKCRKKWMKYEKQPKIPKIGR